MAVDSGTSVETKSVTCSSCDGLCPLQATVKDGRVVKVSAHDNPLLQDVICVKGAYAPKSFAHPDRVQYPLKRVGERGSGEWERVSWDDAMDDIGQRLRAIVDQYGPESLAVAASNVNMSLDSGMTRRFMNLLGSPNFISGVAFCMGNTAAVNRMVYGWYPHADLFRAKCIVLFGHDPRRHCWTMEYKMIRFAQAQGAKLIVLDPRKSENAEAADLWLPLRSGTDAAMCLGWLNVIIEEELYDKEFVEDWTVGFDALAERVREYPLDRVSGITGVEPELIAEAARLYAATSPAAIPWSPITDQQVSSTSAIRLQCILRALTGNLDIQGGENFAGFNPNIRSDTEMELHDVLSEEQKAKQLGADRYPVFTYRGMAPLADATERVWGTRWANLISGCYMAHPTAVFKAMLEGDPYPAKAFIALANNTLMSFVDTRRIYDALMNQDLIVVYEHMKTPTAQLADYILPGDSWLERPSMFAGISERAMDPPGECRSVYFFWRELAKRMGLAEHFPWESEEALLTHKLEPSGQTWKDVLATKSLPGNKHGEKKYLATGFATPSGKVELYSSVLEGLGFDPLPYYREATAPTDEFPLSLFIGLPDDEFYRSGHRHIPELRKRLPDPTLFLNPDDAQTLKIEQNDWAKVETPNGAMTARASIVPAMPKGLVRVPHGWWKPESKRGLESLSGMWAFADAQLHGGQDPGLMDLEQGVPHLKGAPCRVTKLNAKEVGALEAQYGATNQLEMGPTGVVAQAERPEADFMYDNDIGEGVEFDAVELSRYGRESTRLRE